ncbi:hypothetical protein CFP56_021697 [Quercus suber]|uniref:Uncharacterized protein n=1 Tax=Quercus suber TaxID=58331 RepID=A0AAW0KDC6_QUESU
MEDRLCAYRLKLKNYWLFETYIEYWIASTAVVEGYLVNHRHKSYGPGSKKATRKDGLLFKYQSQDHAKDEQQLISLTKMKGSSHSSGELDDEVEFLDLHFHFARNSSLIRCWKNEVAMQNSYAVRIE